MSSVCRTGVALCLWGAIAVRPFAASLNLPPIDGQLSGDFTLTKYASSPKLHWTVLSRGVGVGRRHFEMTVVGTGTRLQLQVETNLAGDGGWRLAEGTLDAAEWFPAVAATLSPALAGGMATGQVVITGSGSLKAGRPVGMVKLAWRDGTLRHAADGWSLEGIAVEGEFAIDPLAPSLTSTTPVELAIRTITTTRFGARNVRVRALLKDEGTLSVQEAGIEIAGGNVTIDPCVVPLSPFALDVKLRISRVGLQDVAALVPTILAEARGRVDGIFNLRWTDAGGLALGTGHLSLRQDELAEVRLAPTPGLISSSLPPAALKYYPGLGQIETGEIPLRAEVLEVAFTPDGDEQGRTATVRLAGGPMDPKLRAPIDLTVNVRGPLDSLIKLGTRSNLHFGGGK